MVERLKNINSLFDFDNSFSCHCEERSDVAIQEKSLDCFVDKSIRNDIIVIGTDEAGRGPGAGGVFASAVYFPNPDDNLVERLSSLNDSKKLSKKKREELYAIILENTINSTVCIEVEEIEKINILNASLKAMRLACENVIEQMQRGKDAKMQSKVGLPSHQTNILVLIDGNKLIKDFNHLTAIQQRCIVKGDSKSASIAAASILAKVSRDRYMDELDKKFPQYNWSKNAGYLTKEHLDAIERHGITPYHRKSFLKGRNTKQLSLLN